MKNNYIKLIILFFLSFISLEVFAQELPRVGGGSAAGILIIIIVMLIVLALYLLIAAFIIGIVLLFLLLGIISASAIVGFKEKSAKKGLKLFIKLFSALLGMLLGLMVDIFYMSDFGGATALDMILSAAGGIIVGYFAGAFVAKLLGKILKLFIKKKDKDAQ